MKLTRPDLMAYATVVVCVVGIVVLTALRVPVPDFLSFAGTTALGIGGGVALQQPTATVAALAAEQPAPAAFVAPAPRPAPVPLTSEPATGVMRVASHPL